MLQSRSFSIDSTFLVITGLQLISYYYYSWLLSGIQSSAFTRNVALYSQGSSCTSSSSYHGFTCRGVIDGRFGINSIYEWISVGEGSKAWIQITLFRPVYVIRIMAINRDSGRGDEVKRAAVLFDNNQTREVTN